MSKAEMRLQILRQVTTTTTFIDLTAKRSHPRSEENPPSAHSLLYEMRR